MTQALQNADEARRATRVRERQGNPQPEYFDAEKNIETIATGSNDLNPQYRIIRSVPTLMTHERKLLNIKLRTPKAKPVVKRKVVPAAVRVLARHEFRRVHPPPIAHAHPELTVTFVASEHYRRFKTPLQGAPANTADFHLLLLHSQGWPLFQRYLEQEIGGTVARNLMFWMRCQDLRKYKANTKEYQVACEDIVTRFIAVEEEIGVAARRDTANAVVYAIKTAQATYTVVGPNVLNQAEWEVFCHLAEEYYEDFMEEEQGDHFRQVLAAEARCREELEVKFFNKRKTIMLQDARAELRKIRMKILYKKQIVASVLLRKQAKSALWHYSRQCKSQHMIAHRGEQAKALAYLAWRVRVSRWHLDKQWHARQVLTAYAKAALIHCAKQDVAFNYLQKRVLHEQAREDALAYLQCSVTLSQICQAVANAGVVYAAQSEAVAWIRNRVARAQKHCDNQYDALEYLTTWGCRVMGTSTPEELRAALQIQQMVRARMARKKIRLLLQASIRKVYDANSGQFYYFNKRTGVVTWSKPVSMGSEEFLTPRSYAGKMVQEQQEALEFARERRKAQRMACGGFTAEEAALVVQVCCVR